MMMLPFADLLERLPLPSCDARATARARLDAIIYGMIAERRASGQRSRRPAVDAAAGAGRRGRRRGMTDRQVRDEAMTIFLAGHETTANALTWTWYLLSQRTGRRGAGCTTKSIACCRAGCRRSRTSPRCRSSRRWSPSRCGCIRRRGSSAGAPSSDYPIGGYVAPRAIDRPDEPVRHAARRALLPGPRALRSRSLDAGVQGGAAAVRVLPVRRRAAPVHRRIVRVDGARARRLPTIAQRWRLRLVPGHPVVPQPLVTLRTKHGMRMTVEMTRALPT